MASSPLLAALSRAPAEPAAPTRRQLLAAAAAACLPPAAVTRHPAGPRIAIVGGGIAGLSAAWRLRRGGLHSTIYEASGRTGGRMWSATGAAAPEVVTELGGEFIDSSHKEIPGIPRRFQLPLIDTAAPTERGLKEEAFLFAGEQRSLAAIAAEFQQLSPVLQRDVRAASQPGWERFDRMTLAG